MRNFIKSEIAANTQRILDRMCENEKQSLRDRLFKSSQREQTTAIVAALRPTTTTAAAA